MFEHLAMWTFPGAVRDEDPTRMVERLKAAHVDIIFPYIMKRVNDSAPFAAYEARLQRIIEEAHRQGLQVHGCFGDDIKVEASLPAEIHALRQVCADGSPSGILCPAHPAVVDYVLGELARALNLFDYDGISLEDSYVFDRKPTFTLRPDSPYPPGGDRARDYTMIPVCYCDYCRKHAPLEQPGWAAWKQERLTDLIAAQARLIRQLKPGIPQSAAARMPYARAFYAPFQQEIPYYDGWAFCQSRDGFGADWGEWLRRGHIDFACPMAYFHSPRLLELQTFECQALTPTAATHVWMGLVLTHTVESSATRGQFPAAPYASDPSLLNDAQGIARLLEAQLRLGQRNAVFFCYEQLLDEHIPVLARYRKR